MDTIDGLLDDGNEVYFKDRMGHLRRGCDCERGG